MSKQKKFILSSFLLTIVFILAQISKSFLSPFFISFFLIFLASLILFFVFYSLVSSVKRLILLITLPLGLLLAVNFFYNLWPSALVWRAILILFLFDGIYASVLVTNIFLVSLEFKKVPLYRAAFTIGFILILLELFLFYNFIFSFKFYPWTNAFLIFLVSWPLLFHFFWSAAISEKEADNQQLIMFSSVGSWFLSQLGLAISFWPVNVGLASLYLVSFAYVLGGMIQAAIKGKLFQRTFWEYFWVGVGSLVALFLLTTIF